LNTPTSTTTVNTPATTRPARRTARSRLVRLLEKYMAVLPPDLRDAVIVARPKLEAAALNGDPEPGPYTIWIVKPEAFCGTCIRAAVDHTAVSQVGKNPERVGQI
jgi:hypothetical protein